MKSKRRTPTRTARTTHSARAVRNAAQTSRTIKKKTEKTVSSVRPKDKATPKEPKIGKLRMGLYWIKDKLMFKDKNGKKINDDTKKHKYVVYHDENGKVDRVVETTHLYEDEKAKKIKSGDLKAYQFGGEEFPSGVENRYIETDVDDKPLKNVNLEETSTGTTIDNGQALSIHAFAKNKRK